MAALRVGVIGLGSVFLTPYRTQLDRLTYEGLVEVTALYDIDAEKRDAARDLLRLGDAAIADPDPEALIARDDVDVVLVLTSMAVHGGLGLAALRAGKHVLIEKPMPRPSPRRRAGRIEPNQCRPTGVRPHIVLSPTYRRMLQRIRAGEIGRPVLGRARYGWSGPWWAEWFYRPGGGALFDLGVYNLTSLCGFMGSVKRVTAMVGTAIPERVAEGRTITVESEDNAHVTLDFGDSRFASFMTGFTMQKYRSPAVEIYGTDGVLQMLGDDWAPEGFEQWRPDVGSWEVVPEIEPTWPWTYGLRHLIESVNAGTPVVTRPEHAYHALEVMLGAMTSAKEGRFVDITSEFPALDYGAMAPVATDDRRVHDTRSGS